MEDALSNEAATKACTRLPIELVEKLVIKVIQNLAWTNLRP